MLQPSYFPAAHSTYWTNFKRFGMQQQVLRVKTGNLTCIHPSLCSGYQEHIVTSKTLHSVRNWNHFLHIYVWHIPPVSWENLKVGEFSILTERGQENKQRYFVRIAYVVAATC